MAEVFLLPLMLPLYSLSLAYSNKSFMTMIYFFHVFWLIWLFVIPWKWSYGLIWFELLLFLEFKNYYIAFSACLFEVLIKLASFSYDLSWWANQEIKHVHIFSAEIQKNNFIVNTNQVNSRLEPHKLLSRGWIVLGSDKNNLSYSFNPQFLYQV